MKLNAKDFSGNRKMYAMKNNNNNNKNKIAKISVLVSSFAC